MLIEAKNLRKMFKKPRVHAVNGISFALEKGKTLGILGESGCGKSTLAKLLLGLLRPDEGSIHFSGKQMQIIFQHPTLSMNPRWRVRDILTEYYHLQGIRDAARLNEKAGELLESVELPNSLKTRYPHELSGGECQRVAIARALSPDPELLVCDEPVSALDAVSQAQILALLLKLQKERKISYIFISHDTRVVRKMSHEVLVMQDGKACEYGPCDEVFNRPQNAYTQLLLKTAIW